MARRRLIATGALGVGAAVVAVVAAATLSGGGDDAPEAASQSTATTTIVRQDLVERESVDGTLGYSDARKVVNRLAGTVTWTPRAGSVVRTNQRLYAVGGEDVYLLDGAYPAYRTLQAGLSGGDVLGFERNMRALGLDSGGAMTVDGTWDAGTTAAAKRWQGGKGLTADGSIEKGRIVFQPGARRVSEVQIAVGSNAAGGGGGGGGGNSPAAYRDDAPTMLMVAAHDDAPARGSSDAVYAQAQAPATTPAPTPTTPQPTTTTPAPTTTTPQPTTTTPAPTTTTATPPQACRCTTTKPSGTRSSGSSTSTPSEGSQRSGSGGGADATTAARSAGGSGSGSNSDDVASELMTTTSTKRIVALDLATTKRSLARRGARVVVELPDGRTVDGTIATVGTVAQRKATSQDDNPPATIKVVVRLRGSVGVSLDQAPVDVQLERHRARDALTVPVTALLARAGGAYAVEVREGGRRRVVEVRTGIYTDSYVEIDGPGLRPGMTVTNSAI